MPQFTYIAAQQETFTVNDWPILSVDAKHRELWGDFKNPGATWSREPTAVNVYDFRSDAKGVAIPYGIYDVGAQPRLPVRRDLPQHAILRRRQRGQMVGL